MYGYTRLWNDGTLKWDKRMSRPKRVKDDDFSYDNILHETLVSCDIKSDIQGETWQVEKFGVMLRHFEISKTTSWEIDKNVITVFSEDELPFKLVFHSITEAVKADGRLYRIINGDYIFNCDDAFNFYCEQPSTLRISFQ